MAKCQLHLVSSSSSSSSSSSLFVITLSKTCIMVMENMHVVSGCRTYNNNVKQNARGIIVSLPAMP